MFDIIIISIISILALKGLITGLTKELSSLIGIIGGVALGSSLGDLTGSVFAPLVGITNTKGSLLLGFVLSLVFFWIISVFVGHLLASFIEKLGLGFADKGLGAFFGGAKIFFIFSIIFYALSNVAFVNKKLEEKVGNGMMYPLLVKTGSYLVTIDFEKIQKPEFNATEIVQKGLNATK